MQKKDYGSSHESGNGIPHFSLDKQDIIKGTGEGMLTANGLGLLMNGIGITPPDIVGWSKNGDLPVKGVTLEMVNDWMSGNAEIPNSVTTYLYVWGKAINEEIDHMYNYIKQNIAMMGNRQNSKGYSSLIKYPDADTYNKFQPQDNEYTTFLMHNKLIDRVHMKLVKDGIKSIIVMFNKDDYITFLKVNGKVHSDETLFAWMEIRGERLFCEK